MLFRIGRLFKLQSLNICSFRYIASIFKGRNTTSEYSENDKVQELFLYNYIAWWVKKHTYQY